MTQKTSPSRPWRIGIDIGGTFTDIVVVGANGDLLVKKSPSIPHDPSAGIFRVIAAAAQAAGISVRELLAGCSAFVHGSTIATNTVLEGKIARTGLLCTAGFRDALTIRRGIRADPWRHREPYPAPLIPRRLRLPVRGRIGPDGREIEPLCRDDVVAALETFEVEQIEAVAVAFLHAHANPIHEKAACAVLDARAPSLPVFLSSEIAPVVGEYARTSTTAAAAAVAPRVVPYLAELERRLAQNGLTAPLLLMQSNGGLVMAAEVARNPAALLLSGPSAGVGALRWLSDMTGRRNLISMEMGGTSCDLILMHDGRIEMTDELEVAGYHIRIPAVDIHTVSAGGGSIARVTAGGVMTLGPDGAGSEPGPAAYDRGGREPTDTDAQVVLGRLPSGPFADGALSLNPARARDAISARIGGKLGLDLIDASDGIVQLQVQALVHAVERVSVERGFDPRSFSLVAVGGAAALHAAAVARRLGCRDVLIPRLAGVFCAFGMLHAEVRRDAVRSFVFAPSHEALRTAEDLFRSLEEEIRATFVRQHLEADAAVMERTFELRYPGQQSSLRIAHSHDPHTIIRHFEAAHLSLYGHVQPSSAPQITALRVTGSVAPPTMAGPPAARASGLAKPYASRHVWIADRGIIDDVSIYRGDELRHGCEISGPAIVEEPTTTILLHPGDTLRVDQSNTIVVSVGSPHRKKARQQREAVA